MEKREERVRIGGREDELKGKERGKITKKKDGRKGEERMTERKIER